LAMMFERSVQPGIVSLFSSTGSAVTEIFSESVDPSLPSDSFIHLLNDATSFPSPLPPATLISVPLICEDIKGESAGHSLSQTVLHIQSPTIRTTFIQCPPAPITDGAPRIDLGLKQRWLHIQVRNLGREWSFEFGLVDQAGRRGVVRCSTFQKEPRLSLPAKSPPLLHLPLSFPSSSSRPLTAWSTIALHLPSFIPHFSSAGLTHNNDLEQRSEPPFAPAVPSGRYSHLAYVKVYATCRLRRIWLNDAGTSQKAPWEFELYSE